MYFHLTDSLFPPTLTSKFRRFMRLMSHLQLRFCYGQTAQERNHDGGGDVPLFKDHPADALPLPAESPDSRLQARERMAICSFGSRTVDSRSYPKSPRIVRETAH